jgi:eukaryotic-like serine/threonine-protein kinase
MVIPDQGRQLSMSVLVFLFAFLFLQFDPSAIFISQKGVWLTWAFRLKNRFMLHVFGFLLVLSFLILIFSNMQQSFIASAQPDNSDSWPMFKHDLQRTGYSTSTVPDTNAIKWIYNTTVEITSSPAISNGRLVVGVSNGDILALNSTTGAKLWAYETEAGQNSIWSSPAVDSGKVYIGTRHLGSLFCLNETDGTLLWTFPTGNDIDSSPAIADGRVYINSNDGKIYCLNSNDGSMLWNYADSNSTIDNYSSATIIDNTVFVGSGLSIFALNAANGELVWSISAAGYISATPVVSNGDVFVVSSSGILCINATTGAIVWNITNVDGETLDFFRSSPAIANNRLFVGAENGNIYCLSASTGSLIWKYKTLREIWSSPAVADGKALIGSSDGKLYCFNESTGTLLWSKMTIDRIVSGPAISEGTVFVGCGGSDLGGGIYAFGARYTNLSSLTLDLNSQTSFIGFKVKLNGFLKSDESPISGKAILLSFSVNGGQTWNDITSVPTATDGSYSAVWVPSATGTYLVKASWKGDYPFSDTEEVRSLSVTLFNDQYVFSVVSNSTVSELGFNSADQELSFTVTGETGTTGFVEVMVAKNLVPNIADLKVRLDGSNLNYKVSPTEDSWVLTFNYEHSTHDVTIMFSGLNGSTTLPTPVPTSQQTQLPSPSPQSGFLGTSLPAAYGYTILVAIILIVAAVIVLSLKRRRR